MNRNVPTHLELKPAPRRGACCLVLAILAPLGGCMTAPSARERYMASRAAYVEPKQGDGSLTISSWPMSSQHPLASMDTGR
ncbi:MAG: hypothetical protein NTV94_01920 [Planctomycetota bacterium]|nr:hypothetical protein [Planctomycetota bacterium]